MSDQANSIHSSLEDDPVIPRRVLSYVEVIRKKFPNIQCISRGPNWSDIEWENPNDAISLTQQVLYPLIIEYTMVDWIHVLFTEANKLQEYASTYYTFSNMGTIHTQISMYQQKHQKAKQYIYELSTYPGDLAEARANVAVPTMLEHEALATGDDPYDLANAIIKNYLSSNEAMTDYYGKVEGERRVVKRRILDCRSIEDLQNLQWATWPQFVPPSDNIGD